LGWFCLFPFEYWRLAEQAAASAVFVANDLFASGAGYLSDGVASAPLIHLWSLGVEEQFYILWPVLIWLIFKMRLSFVWLPLTVGIASIAFGIVKFRSEPLAAFCLTQTRAWELSLGSIAAALPFSDKDLCRVSRFYRSRRPKQPFRCRPSADRAQHSFLFTPRTARGIAGSGRRRLFDNSGR
jgi:peptidoglycan/LPS O-acetylase OafA/YrhL